MVETNFTNTCYMMPFINSKIRIVMRMEFVDESLNITGTRSITPYGFRNETKVIRKDIPFIIIKNENNYQLHMATDYLGKI